MQTVPGCNLWWLALALWSTWLCGFITTTATAQSPDGPVISKPAVGLSGSGLRGLDRIGLPVAHVEQAIALSAGYGFLNDFGPAADDSHRVLGRAAVGLSLSESFAVAVEAAGRLDAHPSEPDNSSDSYISAVGEPRITGRFGHELSSTLQIGADLKVLIPGTSAPSIDPSGISVDLVGQAALLHSWPVSVHLLGGFRLDRTRNLSPDRTRLRVGDQIGLGLSEGNQVLMGVGVHYTATPALQTFAEWTYDWIYQEVAALESPMRLVLGVRYHLQDNLALSLLAQGSLSKRPELGPEAPLVPIEPRVQIIAGLRYAFGGPATEPTELDTRKASPLRGTLVDEDGKPVRGATIRLETSHSNRLLLSRSSASGAFHFPEVPHGPLVLMVAAKNYEPATWTAHHRLGATLAPHTLIARSTHGQLRGLIRSWSSKPLAALVWVQDMEKRTVAKLHAAADGTFQTELAPDTYLVRISATKHRPQVRQVEIRRRGVTVLNVDLRPSRK